MMKRLLFEFHTQWFTIVMGIGIVAGLSATAPFYVPARALLSNTLAGIDGTLLVAATLILLFQLVIHPRKSLKDFLDPARTLFYGAFAMAINVVGNDVLILGAHATYASFAIALSKAIWLIGCVASLFSVLAVPIVLFLRREKSLEHTRAAWLIPVVPPIVAAATGANLLPYFVNSSMRLDMTLAILALFGLTLFFFLVMSVFVVSRLTHHARIGGFEAPSLFIEIGPIGMSMATLSNLAIHSSALSVLSGSVLKTLAILVSCGMYGIGFWWIITASFFSIYHLTRRGDGLKHHLGWWSYVFPLGSFTTGTFSLAMLLGEPAVLRVAGALQFYLLWGFFLIVIAQTIRELILSLTQRTVQKSLPLPAQSAQRDRRRPVTLPSDALDPPTGT
ncbi:hypothetical protein [Ferroacidibacillus organovorans]|uniref:C4-dicarboxylate ABC transporter n=1 Tax=Ferroacidibacillus organovorans TaxID=1765683 RepID=A0A1V4EQK8_9BACL|nr:hypothetical protein [Ferroacidibacillus organovorans]OPG15172.1 hypothetical protein B2M26_13560 [Ferroacidibacillus organovorans]